MGWTESQVAERAHQALPALVRAKGRLRLPKAMNRVESQYYAHLAMRARLGEVLWFKYEGLTLKLGDDCRLTPDFAVMLQDGSIEFHDTKAVRRGSKRAHIEDDALAKMRAAAESFPFTIRAVWPTPDGGWGEREL